MFDCIGLAVGDLEKVNQNGQMPNPRIGAIPNVEE
jgi:hypothetical protein